MGNSVTAETLGQLFKTIRNAPKAGMPADILKAITQNTGLVWYDLEPYAKLLFPVITPLRNEIPRVKGDGGTATHWKSITAINANQVDIGLGEGQRGGSITTTVVDNMATYKSFGLDDSVTFEADLAAENFDDAKELSIQNLLRSVMIGEEKAIVGANSSLPLGVTPTPTLTDQTTGGTLAANTTFSVICVALTYDGYLRDTVVGGVRTQVTRTNTDGTSITFGGGAAQKSLANTVTTANDASATHAIRASVVAVPGAMAYAWYWGAVGAELLGAITTINSALLAATATGTQTAVSLPSADYSTNAYMFDGLLTQIFTAGSGSTIITMPTGTPGTGTPLTGGTSANIVEIDTALKAFWDNYRLSPQAMLVNSQELQTISNKAISGGGTPLFRLLMDAGDLKNPQALQATAGTVVGSYLNKFTMAGGQLVKVLLHPNVPPGTIIFYSRELPYPLSNVRNLLQMKLRRDYFQIEWPITRPTYEFSVWANGVLQNYFPPAYGAITNIAAG